MLHLLWDLMVRYHVHKYLPPVNKYRSFKIFTFLWWVHGGLMFIFMGHKDGRKCHVLIAGCMTSKEADKFSFLFRNSVLKFCAEGRT
jgi:hypothetical protein